MLPLQHCLDVLLWCILFISTCRSDDGGDLIKKICFSPKYREFAMKYNLCRNQDMITVAPTLPAKKVPGGGVQCKCGSPMKTSQMLGTVDMQFIETPWHVGITSDPSQHFFCSGSLINHQWVLSAAHCFFNMARKPCYKQLHPKLYVGLGYYDLFAEPKSDHSFMSRVYKQIPHPEFNCGTMDYDFALVQLAKPVNIGGYLSFVPVCLPPDDSEEYIHQNAMAMGWVISMRDGKLEDKIHRRETHILYNIYSGSARVMTDNMMAVMFDANESSEALSCRGDSGGALAVLHQHQYTQVGVDSYGIHCTRQDLPGMFARVSKALDWITKIAGYYCCANDIIHK